jgi:hypothetical protein
MPYRAAGLAGWSIGRTGRRRGCLALERFGATEAILIDDGQ